MEIRKGRAFLRVLLIVLALASAIAAVAAADFDKPTLEAQKDQLFKQMIGDPTNLDVVFAYADVSARLGDNEAAVSALEQMLLFNPKLPRVDLELGALYFRMGSFDIALSYFAKAADQNPPPEVKERIDQYVAQIARNQAPSQWSGYFMVGAQYQSDANVAPASATINSPIGPVLLSSQFVKTSDINLFATGSALYTHDLGDQDRDAIEVKGTGLVNHYFKVDRLDIDYGEINAGPRFRFPRLADSGFDGVSLKPYAILNEVGLGENQYFFTYGGGTEATAVVPGNIALKAAFEFRQKKFSNAPDRPASTGLDGNDKVFVLTAAKPVTDNSVLAVEFDYVDQLTAFSFYSNQSYAVAASYRLHYDDPLHYLNFPWESSVFVSRLWSFYDAPDPCCNVSQTPTTTFEAGTRTDRHWRFGISHAVQVSDRIAIILQLQRDIVSSNLPLYGYNNNSLLIGAQTRF